MGHSISRTSVIHRGVLNFQALSTLCGLSLGVVALFMLSGGPQARQPTMLRAPVTPRSSPAAVVAEPRTAVYIVSTEEQAADVQALEEQASRIRWENDADPPVRISRIFLVGSRDARAVEELTAAWTAEVIGANVEVIDLRIP